MIDVYNTFIEERIMEYKYKAFISYRHLEPDMQAAERLQKLLEAYKPPKSLGKTKENWRIFRDVSELQSSSDLSEDIRNAVETSEFLIVICSPKYTESKWCMQELTRFRELHGNTNENIITLLVSGLPQESFPEELTYTEMTTVDENGKEVKVKVEVEPLAANITADSLKESMKKLNTEYLRIAAPLLGCDFNDLFQREKRREAARRRRIFGAVSGILSLITVISAVSAVTINRKNVMIQEQNDQITEQNTRIIEQNQQIEKKNNDLLVENAGHLAVESENLFSSSSLIPAIKKAVEALPSEGEEKPVLPEAEYALSRELGMFRHQQLVPRISLKHDSSVEQLSFMGGGKTIVSQDAAGVYFWDAETGSLIRKITGADSEFASQTSGSANKLTAILDVSPDKTGTYFENTSSPGSISYENSSVFNKVYTCYAHSVDDEEPGTGGDVFLSNSDSTLWRLDGATGDVKWTAPLPADAGNCLDIIESEKYIIRLYRDKKVMPGGTEIPGDNTFMELIDRETGASADTANITDIIDSSFTLAMDITILDVRDNRLYIYNSEKEEVQSFEIRDHAPAPADSASLPVPPTGTIRNVYMNFPGGDPLIITGDILAFNTSATLVRYDSELKKQKWSLTLPVNYQNNGGVFFMPAADTGYAHDVITVKTDRTVSFIDCETGEELRTLTLDCSIADISYSRTGLVMFTGDDGEEYTVSLGHFTTGDPSDNAAFRVQTIDTAVSLCSYSRGKYVTAGDYSNTAYIQYTEDNQMFTGIDTGEYMYSPGVPAVSADGSIAAVTSDFYPEGKYDSSTVVVPHLFLYRTADGQLSEVKELEGYSIKGAAFAGDTLVVNAVGRDENGIISSEDKTFCINTSDGSVREAEGAPSATKSKLKLLSAGEGVFFLTAADRSLAYISADGRCRMWGEAEEGSLSPEKEISGGKYAVSGDRAAVLAKAQDGSLSMEVYSFGSGQTTLLDCDLSSDEGLEVRHIFWQNSDTVGVFFSDRTVSLFDTATGKRTASVSLVGTGQEPVSVAPVTDTTFAALCRDSCIYELNAEGLTGRSCRLDLSSSDDNSIRSYDSTNAARLEVMPSAGESHIYVVWDRDQAWLLDTERFTVRYRIDSFSAAPADAGIVFISDDMRSKAGFFPVYTTGQLLTAAKEYLTGVGE